jgi:putative spermidine/putrescine transport system permease protein
MNTSAASPASAAVVTGRNLAAWWQAMPLTLVFVLFFLVPLVLIGMVSFWDFNEYELLPAFTGKHYLAIFDGCSNTTDMCVVLLHPSKMAR